MYGADKKLRLILFDGGFELGGVFSDEEFLLIDFYFIYFILSSTVFLR